MLITGNILHESSSAPQQHKSVQYKWFALYLHWDVSHTDMLQPHFISCRGVSGAGGNMRWPRNFCQFYLVLSLFYSLKRGSNGFIAVKTILKLYQGSRGGPLYSGGRGVSNFFRGGGGGVQIDLSGLMTDEVFQMIYWYCARLTPSRNTALGSGSSCNSAFFLQNIHHLNAVSRTISVTG